MSCFIICCSFFIYISRLKIDLMRCFFVFLCKFKSFLLDELSPKTVIFVFLLKKNDMSKQKSGQIKVKNVFLQLSVVNR